MKRVAYPIEEAIARMNAAAVPARAKRLYAYSLLQGRMPANDDPEYAPEPEPVSASMRVPGAQA
jgi:hypothetical protein